MYVIYDHDNIFDNRTLFDLIVFCKISQEVYWLLASFQLFFYLPGLDQGSWKKLEFS